jgi:hypothetical protein
VVHHPSGWSAPGHLQLFCAVGRGRLIGFATGVNGSADAGGLVANEALAPLDELFPLGATAIENFASAINVVAYLILAAIDKISHSYRSLTTFSAEVIGTFTSALRNIFPGFATALGRIEDADQRAYAESCEKPRQTLSSGIISHNGLSPSNVSF